MNFLNITKKKYYEAVKNPTPLIVGFSITQACNLRCKLCGVSAGEPFSDELTTAEAKSIIDNLSDAGVLHLSFGGGEPTVRKDIIQLASFASRRIESVGIVSNGFSIDSQMAWEIANAGVKHVMVSLDGSDQKTHDANRGRGSYDRVIKALKHIKDVQLQARISFTISQTNYNQLPEMIELAQKYGASLNVQEFFPKGRGEGKNSLILTRKQRRDMQRLLFETQNRIGARRIGFENRYITSEDKKTQKVCCNTALSSGFYDFCVGCFTGIYSLFVSPKGEVRLCGGLGEGKIGNLKNKSLADIWKNSEILKKIRDREKLTGRCGKCAYRYICGGCRKNAYYFKGDIFAEDPLCWRGRTEEELEDTSSYTSNKIPLCKDLEQAAAIA